MEGLKRCSKCGEEKPATAEYFYKVKDSKDGLIRECKICRKEYKKQYRQENADKIKENNKQYYTENEDKMKQYREENADKRSEYRKQYYKEHAEREKECAKQYREENADKVKGWWAKYYIENEDERKEYNKQYRKENIDKIREQHKESNKQYYIENEDKIKEYKKQYRQENTSEIEEYMKQYRKGNRLTLNRNNHIYRARKKALPATLTTQQWQQIKKSFDNRCAYCGKKKKLAQEHFIPLSKGGGYTHNNIIPACKSCNSSKGAKDFFDWFPKQKHCSKTREQEILSYLSQATTPA